MFCGINEVCSIREQAGVADVTFAINLFKVLSFVTCLFFYYIVVIHFIYLFHVGLL